MEDFASRYQQPFGIRVRTTRAEGSCRCQGAVADLYALVYGLGDACSGPRPCRVRRFFDKAIEQDSVPDALGRKCPPWTVKSPASTVPALRELIANAI